MLLPILIGLTIVFPQAPSKALVADRAIITPRRIEKTHGSGDDRCTDVVIRPIVSGLPNPVMKRIRSELELKKVLGEQYELYKNHYTFGFDYGVTYNSNHILAITFKWNAYFANHEKALVFDLRDGRLIKAQDLFREEQLAELIVEIDKKLQTELAQMIRDYEGKRDIEYAWKSENIPLKITLDDLTDFMIDDKGITFFYDPHFGHQSAWAEPEGRYFFKYSELKSFLKSDTVVTQFTK
jgi:hypothetical protein